MDRRKIGKVLIGFSLISFIFLFMYVESGQVYERTYIYTGNNSFSGRYIELEEIDTKEIFFIILLNYSLNI